MSCDVLDGMSDQSFDEKATTGAPEMSIGRADE